MAKVVGGCSRGRDGIFGWVRAEQGEDQAQEVKGLAASLHTVFYPPYLGQDSLDRLLGFAPAK